MDGVPGDRQPQLSATLEIQLRGLHGLIEEAKKNMAEAALLVLALMEQQGVLPDPIAIAEGPDIPFWDYILDAAEETGMDPLTLTALIKAESNFVDKDGDAGERGLCQVMPKGWSEVMSEPYERAREPALNILAGARYWTRQRRWLLSQDAWMKAPDEMWVFVAYNAGRGRTAHWLKNYRLENIPNSRVLKNLRNYYAGLAWAKRKAADNHACNPDP